MITLNGDTGITTPGLINTGSTTLINLTTTGNTILGDQSTDTLNVANGNLVLNSSGNLGIGTSSPAAKLNVVSDVTTAAIIQSSAVASTLAINNTGVDAGYFGTIGSLLGSTSQDLAIYATSGNGVRFYTNGNNDRMRLDSSGNLGLGVTPSAWNTVTPVFQINRAALYGYGNEVSLSANYLFSSGDKYIASDFATRYNQANGQHRFYTAPSGTAGNAITFTQSMTLDASGNLLLGTTGTFNGRLNVVGTGGIASGSLAYFRDSNATGSNNSLGGIVFGSSPGTDYYIGKKSEGTSGFLSFGNGNSGAEFARIDSSGNFMVGVTTPAQTISTNNVLTLKAPGLAAVWGVGPTSSFGTFYISNVGTGVALSQGSTSWGTVSDERLKDIIEPITNAANKVSTLRTVIGKYKTDEAGTRRSFLIAQDVQSVLPEAIDVGEDEAQTLSVKYTETIPLLVAAIKELKAELDSVKSELATIKGAA